MGAGSLGSIPAYTGETADIAVEAREAQVYPRIYGGNFHRNGFENASEGLSPHIRGKRPAPSLDLIAERSIPAFTGETWW